MMEGEVRRIVEYNLSLYRTPPPVGADEIHANFMKAVKRGQNHVFAYFPGVEAPRWSDSVRKQFWKDMQSE